MTSISLLLVTLKMSPHTDLANQYVCWLIPNACQPDDRDDIQVNADVGLHAAVSH